MDRSAELQEFYDDILVTFADGGIQMLGVVLDFANADHDLHGLPGIKAYGTITVQYLDETESHDVTADTVATAFGRINGADPISYLGEQARKRYRLAYRERDAGDIDAVDATNLVEIALFGEVVYA